MEPFFVHLIKSSAVLLLFLGSYHFFLKGETLFNSNRWFLLVGLMSSLIAPFITITKTVWVPLPPETSVEPLYAFAATADPQTEVHVVESFNWIRLLTIIYLSGVVLFGIRLFWQLYQIRNIKKNSTIEREAQFYHAKTHQQIAPFSFFNYIFYYPFQFSSKELNTVLDHEKVHVSEYHSLDVIIMELFLVFMWFNPATWYYKLVIKQNLEFLADSKSQKDSSERKFYQYLMLKQTLGPNYASITNPFYNSLIKKRIVMLNKKPSKKL
ncbi:MAG: M56 family metallopeptidase, partial [Flavobacteriaceae bacterium]